MRVAVTGFGRVWRHRLGKENEKWGFAAAVYYNTTGVLVNGDLRQRPSICGYARFEASGGFDPHHPSTMIGRTFECAEPTIWMGCNKLLFKRLLKKSEHADYLLVVAASDLLGQLPVGEKYWRSDDSWLLSFSECPGQQEAMLLMPFGGWLRTSVGKFVLDSTPSGLLTGRLALSANA